MEIRSGSETSKRVVADTLSASTHEALLESGTCWRRRSLHPYVQLGAVSGCSLCASTLGLGSFTMFFNCRLIHNSTGKL
jgi:hypothetical protein